MSLNLKPINNNISNVDSKLKYLKRQVSEISSDMHEIKADTASSKEISAIAMVKKNCLFEENDTAYGKLFVLMKEAAVIEQWTKSAIPNHIWQIFDDKTKQKLLADLKKLPKSSFNGVQNGSMGLSADMKLSVEEKEQVIRSDIKRYQGFMHDAFNAADEANAKYKSLEFYPLNGDMKIDLTKSQIKEYDKSRIKIYQSISLKDSKWSINDKEVKSDIADALKSHEDLHNYYAYCTEINVRKDKRKKLKRLEALESDENEEFFSYDARKKYKCVEFSMKHLEGEAKHYVAGLRRLYLHGFQIDETKKKLKDIFEFMIREHKKMNKQNWCVMYENRELASNQTSIDLDQDKRDEFQEKGQSMKYYRFENFEPGENKSKTYYWRYNDQMYYGIRFLEYNFVFWKRFLNSWIKKYASNNVTDFEQDFEKSVEKKDVATQITQALFVQDLTQTQKKIDEASLESLDLQVAKELKNQTKLFLESITYFNKSQKLPRFKKKIDDIKQFAQSQYEERFLDKFGSFTRKHFKQLTEALEESAEKIHFWESKFFEDLKQQVNLLKKIEPHDSKKIIEDFKKLKLKGDDLKQPRDAFVQELEKKHNVDSEVENQTTT